MGGLLKHTWRNVWVGSAQRFDAVDRLPVRLLRDLWPTPAPPSTPPLLPTHTVTWVFLLFFLSWRPYGALLHFKGRGVLASSGSLGGMRTRFIMARERWHTSVKMTRQELFFFFEENRFLSFPKHSYKEISVMLVMKANFESCQDADHTGNSRWGVTDDCRCRRWKKEAKNGGSVWSTYRGCMPVAMPMLPGDKLRKGVFV